MTLLACQIFSTVAHEGSFARTAEQLHLTPSAISHELHCNQEYLGRVYRLHFGESIAAAINRRRVEVAARLLTSEGLSVKEIMNRVGFQDPAYFRRKFRQRYGVSPKDYRRFLNTGHRNTEYPRGGGRAPPPPEKIPPLSESP